MIINTKYKKKIYNEFLSVDVKLNRSTREASWLSTTELVYSDGKITKVILKIKFRWNSL